MIISVSYKTDIPAFYGKWFMNRLHTGFCNIVNPYGKQIYRVDLHKENVDGFVFWTKNISPFIDNLEIIKGLGFPFFIQYTINNYPRQLEPSVTDYKKSIINVKKIVEKYGGRTVVWRYDTILLTSLTPIQYHLENFDMLCDNLEGFVDESVISFAQIYRKTLRNVNIAAKKNGFRWEDPSDELKIQILRKLHKISEEHNIQLTMCSQPQYLLPGIKEAHCIDIQRLSDIAGYSISAKLKGNRKGCACYYARDIGEYDSCPHGCVYCYAVQDKKTALQRYRSHNPESEFLIEPENFVKYDADVKIQNTLF